MSLRERKMSQPGGEYINSAAAGGLVFLSAAVASALMIACGTDHSITGFPLDDAWIHQVYGRSLAATGMLAYNDRIPSTGSTSPLWAVLLATVHLVSDDTNRVVFLTKLLGALWHALTSFFVFRIVRYTTGHLIGAALVGALVAVSPPLAMASVSGMEISLACACAILALDYVVRRRPFKAGFFLAMACLARPEFASVGLVAGFYFLFECLRRKAIPLQDVVKPAFWPALFGIIFGLRNLSIDGRLLPATFYQKAMFVGLMSWPDRLITGVQMLAGYPPLVGGAPVLGLIGLILLPPSRARVAGVLFFSAGSAFFLSSITLIPPYDAAAFYHIRYLLPSVPLFAAAFGIGMIGLATAKQLNPLMPAQKRRAESMLRPLTWLVTAVVVCFSVLDFQQWSTKLAEDSRNINEVQVDLAKRIGHCAPADWIVATVDAGAARYIGDRFTIDLMGLNTPPDRIESGIRIYDTRCDMLMLMPAWLTIIKSPPLQVVCRSSTESYRVTSNKAMAVQLLAACTNMSGPDGTQETAYMTVLGRPLSLKLLCVNSAKLQCFRPKVGFRKDRDLVEAEHGCDDLLTQSAGVTYAQTRVKNPIFSARHSRSSASRTQRRQRDGILRSERPLSYRSRPRRLPGWQHRRTIRVKI